ncbi:hypothetical protein MTO96_048060 [Rhipicephalus appendiculatus]
MIRRSKVHPAVLIALPFLATLLLMTSPPWGLLAGRGSGKVPPGVPKAPLLELRPGDTGAQRSAPELFAARPAPVPSSRVAVPQPCHARRVQGSAALADVHRFVRQPPVQHVVRLLAL